MRIAGTPFMEILSEPAYTEETVTDLDIGFSNGAVKQLTLRANDHLTKSAEATIVVFGGINGEMIGFNNRHVAWMSERRRVIRTPVKGAPTAKGSSPLPTAPPTTAGQGDTGQSLDLQFLKSSALQNP